MEKRLNPEQAFQHPWIKTGILELKKKIESEKAETAKLRKVIISERNNVTKSIETIMISPEVLKHSLGNFK